MMDRRQQTRRQLDDALASRILILDGAMGTMLQEHNPTAEDFGGVHLENCNENLCRTRPDWIVDIHRAYLEAGSDIIETNSFQGSPIVLAEFNLEDQTKVIPVGLGLGRIWTFGQGNNINAYVEPQYSVLHDGAGVAIWQVYAGVNVQF